jgi:hypothetical protein
VARHARPLHSLYSRFYRALPARAGTGQWRVPCQVLSARLGQVSTSSLILAGGHYELTVTRLPKPNGNEHVLACVRRGMVSIHYCYICYRWVIGDDWGDHCRTHIGSLMSTKCGTITYCQTLVRPGFCPLCLADKGLTPSHRVASWSRDHTLWTHVNELLLGQSWPMPCPHPLCEVSLFRRENAILPLCGRP